MKVGFIIIAFLLTSVAHAGAMPWGIKSKLSLGLEKQQAPYLVEEAEKHYDLGLEFSNGYSMSRKYGLSGEWKVKYLYENWYELEDDNLQKDGHTYRLEWHLHF